ncbi:MAG: UDP-N-acetylmuramate dehydrogenase [Candidatus Magasanikbacteria bacterium]
MDYKKLKEFGKVKLNEPLAKYTTFKIGGPADCFVIVDTSENFAEVLKYLDGVGQDYIILAGGSNVLVGDAGYKGVVIHPRNSKLEIRNSGILVEAGCPTARAAQESIKAGFVDFAWGVGIPGTIGGAIRGNAGAMGSEMKDHVEKLEVYRDGEVIELSNEECEFGYRESIFKHGGGIILRAWLKLEKGDAGKAMKEAMEHLSYRACNQPQGFGSAGCTFKNLPISKEEQEIIKSKTDDPKVLETMEKYNKVPIGRLIELCGLRGFRIGNAGVSEKHGNFIVNLGEATAEDVHTVIEKVKEKVYTTFGISIQEEIYFM